jgi:uncharacterized protein with von Willebrand factor type A (vWA) domain
VVRASASACERSIALHARRVLQAGAVLLLISDGWETGDAVLLSMPRCGACGSAVIASSG